MVQGAGRPGQPIAGQRSIFGGGGPVFAQMPTYTPVTRGPAQQAPEPPQQPAYSPYTPNQPAPPSFQNPFAAAPSQPAPQPAPPPAPSYPTHHTNAAPSYSAPDFQPQAYRSANQPASAPSAEHAGAQTYPAPSYNSGFQGQPYQPQNYPDASFGDASYGDASFETPTQDASYAEPKFAEQNFGKQNYGDASFEDASFPDTSFAASNSPFSHLESSLDGGLAQHQHSEADQGFETYTEQAAQDYVMASQGGGQAPPSDPRRQLQAFDALYDQPPQIALGSTEQARRAPQDFYESERVDADFLDEGQVVPPAGARSKMATLKSRSAFMVGSALLGAIALGGALAFAYKQSGGGIGSGEQPPLVTADARPVKELPDQPGGKEFPHKNKLIYDRLQNGDEPESERIVPRQEDVAVPALPAAPTELAGLPTPVATTDMVTPQTTQAVDGAPAPAAAPMAVAAADDSADGGPRRVKTLKVRPDGSVEEPAGAPAAAAEGAAQPAMAAAAADGETAALPAAAAMPVPAADPPVAAAAPAKPQQVAAVQPAPVKPKAPKPAVAQASATPQAATPNTKYVVQVGSKKNQTEALASFADMQQKYPTLLASYRPMVQKADLGAKGVWYRLRIGPIADKSAAAKLCSQLKAQGLPDCLVASQ
jgi:SPOR domain